MLPRKCLSVAHLPYKVYDSRPKESTPPRVTQQRVSAARVPSTLFAESGPPEEARAPTHPVCPVIAVLRFIERRSEVPQRAYVLRFARGGAVKVAVKHELALLRRIQLHLRMVDGGLRELAGAESCGPRSGLHALRVSARVVRQKAPLLLARSRPREHPRLRPQAAEAQVGSAEENWGRLCGSVGPGAPSAPGRASERDDGDVG
jgi:hypothetical protein